MARGPRGRVRQNRGAGSGGHGPDTAPGARRMPVESPAARSGRGRGCRDGHGLAATRGVAGTFRRALAALACHAGRPGGGPPPPRRRIAGPFAARGLSRRVRGVARAPGPTAAGGGDGQRGRGRGRESDGATVGLRGAGSGGRARRSCWATGWRAGFRGGARGSRAPPVPAKPRRRARFPVSSPGRACARGRRRCRPPSCASGCRGGASPWPRRGPAPRRSAC